MVRAVAFPPDSKILECEYFLGRFSFLDVEVGNIKLSDTTDAFQFSYTANTGIPQSRHPVGPNHQTFTSLPLMLHVSDNWIYFGGQRFFLLPHDYRAAIFSVQSNTVALASNSGRVCFFQFHLDLIPC